MLLERLLVRASPALALSPILLRQLARSTPISWPRPVGAGTAGRAAGRHRSRKHTSTAIQSEAQPLEQKPGPTAEIRLAVSAEAKRGIG